MNEVLTTDERNELQSLRDIVRSVRKTLATPEAMSLTTWATIVKINSDAYVNALTEVSPDEAALRELVLKCQEILRNGNGPIKAGTTYLTELTAWQIVGTVAMLGVYDKTELRVLLDTVTAKLSPTNE